MDKTQAERRHLVIGRRKDFLRWREEYVDAIGNHVASEEEWIIAMQEVWDEYKILPQDYFTDIWFLMDAFVRFPRLREQMLILFEIDVKQPDSRVHFWPMEAGDTLKLKPVARATVKQNRKVLC